MAGLVCVLPSAGCTSLKGRNMPTSGSDRLAIGLLALILLGGACSTAYAVPAFARKYQTSCSTCHVIFPKLNAFGEAFRLRGYRMPKETEEMIKQPPVSLGSPAYKKLWPNAIWPGEISSSVPLAVNIKMADLSTSTLNDDGSVTSVKNDFQFPQEANIFGAGTLGDHVSYLAEVTFSENADSSVSTELEHARLQFDSPFGKEDLFHFRIGKFAPNLADGFQEMWIATDAAIDSVFAYNPIGPNGGTSLAGDMSPAPIAFPDRVRGIEGYGIIAHRALWVAGMSNGIGPSPSGAFDGNNAKDVYARFDYKIGGLGLDGDTGGREVPEKNWRDNSLRLGVFTYRGDGSNINFPATLPDGSTQQLQDLHFLRTGFYASAYFQDLNVFGAYVHGTDTLQAFSDGAAIAPSFAPTYNSWFTQADYLVYPWLQGTFRYETVTPGDRSVPSLRTGVFNVSALIRANVKVMAEYQRDLRHGDNHSFGAFLRFAF
jgi:hypothetical protein